MGRDKKNEQKTEHFAKMVRSTMETPAWRALSSTAQALYPWLRLEWNGPKYHNNGRIRLSTRQAADRLGVTTDTASKAFHDLQRKGFIVVKKGAQLGLHGQGKSTEYELTEISLPNSEKNTGRKLYQEWKRDNEFPVIKAPVHNPRGENGR